MFPSLFLNESVDSFHCDMYQIAKHHHKRFPSNSNKSNRPFALFWGPASTPNIYECKLGIKQRLNSYEGKDRIFWRKDWEWERIGLSNILSDVTALPCTVNSSLTDPEYKWIQHG